MHQTTIPLEHNYRSQEDKMTRLMILSAHNIILCHHRTHPHPRRLILSQHTSSFSTEPKSPTKPSTSWERGAKLVKKTDVTNQYLDKVRAEVGPALLQIKTIEDELCGAIGKALGKQGDKVLIAIRKMKEEHLQYIEHIKNQSYEQALQAALSYNEARKNAIKARWELLVHRQAVGFTVDNHSVVHSTFPIGPSLPSKIEDTRPKSGLLDDEDGTKQTSVDTTTSSEQPQKKVWGDQLSWWQRVGRWK